MTPQQWIEGISAGSTLVLIALASGFAYLRKVIKGWRELMTETKHQATAAASSAARVDDSMHTNNGGSHQKDVNDQVLSTLRDLRRDVGGMREDIRNLARVDQADREAEAAEHVRLWAAIDRQS